MTEHTITRDDQGDWSVDGKLMAATNAADAREFADQHAKWAERYVALADHLERGAEREAENAEVERLAQVYWFGRGTTSNVMDNCRAGIRAVLAAQKAGGSE